MRGRSSARPARRSQHYLATRRLAVEIVEAADLSSSDLVVELGAGFGRLTEALVERAGEVVAVELDPSLAARLRARLGARDGRLRVVEADLLTAPLPSRPYRVVANPPFHLTAELLARLLDSPGSHLERADLVLGWGAALSLTAVHPPARRPLRWLPWWEFVLVRRIPAAAFQPPPGSDAALVSIRRRRTPLLPAERAAAYRHWLRHRQPADVWAALAGFHSRL